MKSILLFSLLLSGAFVSAGAFAKDDIIPRTSCTALDSAGVRFYGWGNNGVQAGREAYRNCTYRSRVGGCYVTKNCPGYHDRSTEN
ncbi:MAG TPA: hypothetical protein VIH99_09925 [Bdellovibrionota bacterium]|jgi:hypothetical protein